jgi:hypothetical protein
MVFAEIVMKHMDEIGMTAGEPEVCHYAAQVGNADCGQHGVSRALWFLGHAAAVVILLATAWVLVVAWRHR